MNAILIAITFLTSVWAQLMNRAQQRLDLVLIPLDNFCESYSSTTSSPTGDHSWKAPLTKTTSSIQVTLLIL